MAADQLHETTPAKDTDPKAAQQAPAPVQTGVQALDALIAKGPPDPKAVVEIIDGHRSERDAIMARLQATMGNAYVQQVVHAMGLRASIPRKEVVAGDPSDPESDYFLASAEQKGAKWRAGDGDFTGTIDKNGLDATEKLNAHDSIHEKINADKTGTVDWNRDGKTEAEAYGSYKSGTDYKAGVKTDQKLGDGDLHLDGSYTKSGTNGTAELDGSWKDKNTNVTGAVGETNGKFFGNGHVDHTFDNGSKASGDLSVKDGTEKLSGHYEDKKLSANGSITDDHGKVSEAADATYKLNDKTTLTGSVENGNGHNTEKLGAAYKDDKLTANAGITAKDGKLSESADATYKLNDKTTLTGSVANGDGHNTEKLGAAYKDDKLTANAGVTATDGKLSENADATYKLNDKTTLTGSVTNGNGHNTEKLGAAYKDDKLTANAGVTATDGKLAENIDAAYKLDDKTNLTGSATHDKDNTELKLGGDHTFAGGGKGTLGSDFKFGSGHNSEQLTGSYKDNKWDTNASLGLADGKFSGSGSAAYKLDDKTNLHGSGEYNPNLTDFKLGGDHTFGNGGKGALDLEYKDAAGKRTESLTGSYKDKDTELKGSFGAENGQFFGNASATKNWKLSPQDSLSATAGYSKLPGQPSNGTFGITQKHDGDKLIESASLEGGFGSKDYLKGTGSVEGQLGKNLYAGGWGSFSAENGKHTSAELGASLTFTPSEKTALTLAGVVNDSGQFETRLQFDLFKDRINGISDLSQHKKDAIVSLFASVTTGGHDPGMMNDRFGAPNNSFNIPGGGNETKAMLGVRFRF